MSNVLIFFALMCQAEPHRAATMYTLHKKCLIELTECYGKSITINVFSAPHVMKCIREKK